MKKGLVINASARAERSYSRKLTELFVNTWKLSYQQDEFIYREVGLDPIPPITKDWIASAFIKVENRTTENQQPLLLSNVLVSELKVADVYVIGTPMYNWSIPSSLKAYIDQVMRINETWRFKSGEPDGNYVGLLKNKRLYILSTRGDSGYNDGEANAHMNFQTTYLKMIFNIMGVNDVEVISLDNEEYGGEKFKASQSAIYHQIENLNLLR